MRHQSHQTTEKIDHVAHQGLGLEVIFRRCDVICLGYPGLEIGLFSDPLVNPDALHTLHDDAHGAIRCLDETVDDGSSAYLIHLVGAWRIDLSVL